MLAQRKIFEEGGDPPHRGGGLPSEGGGMTSSVRCPPPSPPQMETLYFETISGKQSEGLIYKLRMHLIDS